MEPNSSEEGNRFFKKTPILGHPSPYPAISIYISLGAQSETFYGFRNTLLEKTHLVETKAPSRRKASTQVKSGGEMPFDSDRNDYIHVLFSKGPPG